jgi:hypothetical protein
MIDDVLIVVLRGVDSGSSEGEESDGCLEGVVSFEWRVWVSE